MYKNRFDGGEIDKWALGAVDDPMYRMGLAWLENMGQLENGGLNRRRGWKRLCEILAGTGDEAVKLVPVPVDAATNYVFFVSKSKYGYVKFVNGEYDSAAEYDGPAPFDVSDNHKFPYKEKDPYAYYSVLAVQKISTEDDIAVGAEGYMTAANMNSPANIKVEAQTVDNTGLLESVNPIEVNPLPVLVNRIVTQERKTEEGECYFDEEGAGHGLQVSMSVSAPDESGYGTIKFTVLNGGDGYSAVEGNYTYLRIVDASIGEITARALVSPLGAIQSIEDAKYYGGTAFPENQLVWWRFHAGPPENLVSPGERGPFIGDYYDMLGRQPTKNPVVVISASAPFYTSGFGKIPLYRLNFDVQDGGSGFVRSYPTDNLDSVFADIVFLDMRFNGMIRGVLCDRHLQVVGRLKRIYGPDGKTTAITGELATINGVSNWFDDGMALDWPLDPSGIPKYNISTDDAWHYDVYGTREGHFLKYGTFNTTYYTDINSNFCISIFAPALNVEDGLWYSKTGRWIDNYWSPLASGDFCWNVTAGTANGDNYAFGLGDETGQPALYGMDVMAPATLQFENNGRMVESAVGSTIIRKKLNYTLPPDFQKFNKVWTTKEGDTNDRTSVKLGIQDYGDVIPEYAETLKGLGAQLIVSSVYDRATDTVKMKIAVYQKGSDYLALPGVNEIDLNLYYRTGTAKYVYTLKLGASRDVNGGLMLTGAASSGYVEVTVPAVFLNPTPESDDEVTLVSADGSATAQARTEVSKTGDGWRIQPTVLLAENGKPDSSGGWAIGATAQFLSKNGETYGGFIAAEIIVQKNYTMSVIPDNPDEPEKGGGSFYRDIKGVPATAVIDGKQYKTTATDTKFNTEDFLFGVESPAEDAIYEVETDETADFITTYWKWTAGKWKQQAQVALPTEDNTVNRLQYVYNGAIVAFAGSGILPFWLKLETIQGGERLVIGGFNVKRAVDYELTAPEEFGRLPVNTVNDGAVPVNFCWTASDSPSVIYFDNGRWWFAGTPNEPNRIWVSKPVKNRDDTELDFSTYINFLTVTPELVPFTARNALKTNVLSAVSDGAIGFALDAMMQETKGKDVSFGFINPSIIGTPYFKDGAEVRSVGETIVLDASSVPQPDEYTAEAMAELQRMCALYYGLCQLKITVPGAFCSVTADTDGFEVRIYSHPTDGGAGPAGVFARIAAETYLAVPYTAWGAGAARVGNIAAAAAATALAAANPIEAAAVAASVAAIGASASAITKAIVEKFFSGLRLKLTDGSTFRPSMSDLGLSSGDQITKDTLVAKKDYMLSVKKLYDDKQPFIMRRWKVEESRYSTAGCGFTFVMSSEEKEDINLITNNRSLFISTTSSERIMPSTVNGEAQAAQTGSFFGSEKLQPAKAADALYYLQRGGQRIMRAYWQPEVPVPSIGDIQKYNREILRNREVISMKSSKSLPAQVWCVMRDGGVALVTDASGGGQPAWGRITTGAGRILDTAPLPINGMSVLRTAAVKNDKGVFLCGILEQQSEPDDIFLDDWQPYTTDIRGDYTAEAVIYDKTANRVYAVNAPDLPPPGTGLYIGYTYMAKFRTLPVPETQAMKPVRMARVRMRFMESELPFIKGCPSGAVNKIVSLHKGRYVDGVADIPVPGNVELDAAFEVFNEAPGPLSVLCLLTEDEV
jgi:hypothetical protein